MKNMLLLGLISLLVIGIYNLIYKNTLKDYKPLDLSDKTWEEE